MHTVARSRFLRKGSLQIYIPLLLFMSSIYMILRFIRRNNHFYHLLLESLDSSSTKKMTVPSSSAAIASQGVEIPEILKDVVISKVKPSSDYEHPKVVYPSVFDLFLIIDSYVSNFFLYRLDPKDPSAYRNFVHAVKSSLSEALSSNAPMAGTWVSTSDIWTRQLICEGEASGAVFVEAAVEDAMAKFMNESQNLIRPEIFLGQYALPALNSRTRHKTPASKEWPSLIVQVTKFRCGGVALVVNFCHMTVDGVGFNNFMKSWVDIATTGRTFVVKASCDRSMLVSPVQLGSTMGFSPEVKNVDDRLSNMFKFETSEKLMEMESRTFYIKSETIETLKQKAKESGHPSEQLEIPQRFSKFDCLTAALWRCILKVPGSAEGMSCEDDVAFIFPVEGRRRWNDPPLPEDYTGNVILILSLPMIPSSDLCSKSFSFAASTVHELVASVNPHTAKDFLNRQLHAAAQMKALREAMPPGDADQPKKGLHVVIFSSWLNFGNFYELDFGAGKPFFASPSFASPSQASDNLMCTVLFLPPPPNTGYAACLHFDIHESVMKVLFADPEFQMLIS